MNYKDMVNEVLIRMREDEIESVIDPDNDPQQKIVCKLVNDAFRFVARSHAWNAFRKVWVVDLAHGIDKYVLSKGIESSSVYAVTTAAKKRLREEDARVFALDKRVQGSPDRYHVGTVNQHQLELTVSPTPDNTHRGTGNSAEYAFGQYGVASYNDPRKIIIVSGFAQPKRLELDDDYITMPIDPLMQFALAYAHSERGEAGDQSVMELFAIARTSLSDAISWDVSNSPNEYLWSAV